MVGRIKLYNKFLTHSTPVNSTSNEAKLSIINSLETAGVTFNSLLAIGCDGTVVNTGNKNGIIAKVERYVGRPPVSYTHLTLPTNREV